MVPLHLVKIVTEILLGNVPLANPETVTTVLAADHRQVF